MKSKEPLLNISYDNYTPHPLNLDTNYIQKLISEKIFLVPNEGEFELDNMSSMSPNFTYDLKKD